MKSEDIATAVTSRFDGAITGRSEFRGELSFSIRPDSLRQACQFCRDELSFDVLLDISSVDLFVQEPRYEVVYELYSLKHHLYLRLKTTATEDDPQIASVCDIWPSANWQEREVWDMMGIRFAGHPDLRRILMWEGYPYHPLRKDFPLEGMHSDKPGVAFTDAAPIAGGPFVTAPLHGTAIAREPRARRAGDIPPGSTPDAEP